MRLWEHELRSKAFRVKSNVAAKDLEDALELTEEMAAEKAAAYAVDAAEQRSAEQARIAFVIPSLLVLF